MGKQIRFFLLNNDEVGFIQTEYNNGDIIVDKHLNLMNMEDITKCNKFIFYILSKESKVYKNQTNFLEVSSEAIEFSRSVPRNENRVDYGIM